MLYKIRAFLYAVTHAHGQLLSLQAELGPFRLALWVGRVNPKAVAFAVDVTFDYYMYPSLDVTVEAGVIEVTLSLTRSRPE